MARYLPDPSLFYTKLSKHFTENGFVMNEYYDQFTFNKIKWYMENK